MVKMLPDPPPAALRLRLDLTALEANWLALDRLSGSAAAGAAVKADAYGIGVAQALPRLLAAGCREFFVAHWSEVGDVLAQQVEPGSVAVLHGPLSGADAAFARATGVRPVINSLAQARLWIESGGGACDLMVDTGINRLGLPLSDLGNELVARLEIDVLHSHLAAAEEESPLNALQRDGLNTARQTVRHRRASLANSAGIALGETYHGDLTRPGLSLYGGVPCAALAPHVRQVAYPEALVMQVRQLSPGASVGYNATYVAQQAMRVGVVALGYADGVLRCWSGGKGILLAGQRRLPVLGLVSMDMTVVDLSAAPDVHEGDWLALDYALPAGAKATGLSQYELLTLLGRRFARS
jgi:alanine racemase